MHRKSNVSQKNYVNDLLAQFGASHAQLLMKPLFSNTIMETLFLWFFFFFFKVIWPCRSKLSWTPLRLYIPVIPKKKIHNCLQSIYPKKKNNKLYYPMSWCCKIPKCMMKPGLNIVCKTDKNKQDAYDLSCKWAFTDPMQKLPHRRTSSDLLILSC